MINSESIQITLLVTKVLDELDVRYVAGGSVASIIHGVSRLTMDVDLVADIQLQHIEDFVTRLHGAFYIDGPSIRRAVENQGSFNLIHLKTMFKVDVFIPKNRPFDQQQLNHRISEKISDDSEAQIWVLSPEDVILAKLDWFRMGGQVSERQWRDVLGVLKVQQSNLDIDYLMQWAENLGVLDLLQSAIEAVND